MYKHFLAILLLVSCVPATTQNPVVTPPPPVVITPTPPVPTPSEAPQVKLVYNAPYATLLNLSPKAITSGVLVRFHGANLSGYKGLCQRRLFVKDGTGYKETLTGELTFTFENGEYVPAPNGIFQQLNTLTCPVASLESYAALYLGKVFGQVESVELLWSGGTVPLFL